MTRQMLGTGGIVLVLGAVLWTFWAMNRLIGFRTYIRDAWGELNFGLDKRHDLVGALLTMFDELAPDGSDRIQAVVSARTQALVRTHNLANQLASEKSLVKAVTKMLELVETNATLARSLQVVSKGQELLANESHLADCERTYNARVHEYNQACRDLPTSLVAKVGGLRPLPTLKLDLIEGSGTLQTSSTGPGNTAVFN